MIIGEVRNTLRKIQMPLLHVVFLIFSSTSCTLKSENLNRSVIVIVPSLSQDMDLDGSQTYAGMMVVNSTSAHLVRLSDDLKITGELLKDYSISPDHKKYTIKLNSDYMSSKKEGISAADVSFTLKYYLKHKRALVPFLINIKGADSCSVAKCELNGVVPISENILEIELNQSDLRFVEKLASPWFVLLKIDRPPTEKIGECTVPYQTGTMSLVKCNSKLVVLRDRNDEVTLQTRSETVPVGSRVMRVESLKEAHNYNTPSLSVLSVYINSRNLNKFLKSYPQYFAKNSTIRKSIQAYLHKDPAFNITPRWMQSWPAEKENEIKAKTVCKAPISVAVDNSLPDVHNFAEFLKGVMPCVKKVDVIAADQFFEKTKTHDLIFCWFTPDYLDFYNIFSVFDCSNQSFCYFDYKDKSINNKLQLLKRQSDSGIMDQELAHKIDNELIRKGYVFPLVHLDWRIVHGEKSWPVHTAGLFQLRAVDFVKVE